MAGETWSAKLQWLSSGGAWGVFNENSLVPAKVCSLSLKIYVNNSIRPRISKQMLARNFLHGRFIDHHLNN